MLPSSPDGPRSFAKSVLLGLGGALLLMPVAQRFRIDQVRCDAWPPWPERLALCLLYLLCVLLLFVGWQRLLRLAASQAVSLRQVLGTVGLWHGALLLSPPFLSDDPLFYLAIGRVLHAPQGSLSQPILTVLGPHDDLVRLLPTHWQQGTTAYQPGFHALAWLVEALPQLSVAGRLKVYQALSGVLVLGTSILAAAVAKRRGLAPEYGAALVGLSPLALLEATLSAHNDVWLMLLVALAAWLGLHRFRPRSVTVALPLLPLLAGLLVKVSALLALFTWGVASLRPHLRQRPLGWLALGTLLLGMGLGLTRWLHLDSQLLTVVLGSPDLPWDHCTRSLECLPRSILRYGLDRPDLSYRVGLLFRMVGGLWLLRVAWRASDPAAATAFGLLSYYLYLHGWAQSWYLLSVLPLRPFLSQPRGRALEVLCGSGCAYYALALFRNCTTEPWQVALCELAEGLITVLPPTIVLLRKEPLAYVRPAP